MAAYRRVYDSRNLQADSQQPGSAPEPYARQSSMGYLLPFFISMLGAAGKHIKHIHLKSDHYLCEFVVIR